VLVIDDTAILKKGKHSVGVAPQYCSTLGKVANCQTLVSLTLARREVPIMLALRLFLPENWTSDPSRLKRAGVPQAYRKPRTKAEVALEELDRVIAAGARFGCVLTDAGYGQSASFRQGLTDRELSWLSGFPATSSLSGQCENDPADGAARAPPFADSARPVAIRRRHVGEGSMAKD
jgi:SRSO17 transposase